VTLTQNSQGKKVKAAKGISLTEWLCHSLTRGTATGVFLAAGLLFSPVRAGASVIVPTEPSLFFGFNNVFSGTGPVSTSLPWVTMIIQDMGSGTVSLTISNSALTGTEFLSEYDFNLDPGLNPANLQFTYMTGSGGFAAPTIQTGTDAFKADGDGKYDISFGFATADGGANRFTAGEYVTYQIAITGSGLTPSDFNFLSTSAGGHGPFYAAAHAQNTGVGGCYSGWISVTQVTPVPEPGTPALAVVGGLLLAGWTVRRRQESNRRITPRNQP
jgi:hypothetical protein